MVWIHSLLWLDLLFKVYIFPKASRVSENLISAKLPILGMQFKTIDFLCCTLLSVSPGLQTPSPNYIFASRLPTWSLSEQCRCQLISVCARAWVPQGSQQHLKECHGPWIPNRPARCDKCWAVRRGAARAELVPTKQPDTFIRHCLTHCTPALMKSSAPPTLTKWRAHSKPRGANKYHPVKKALAPGSSVAPLKRE